MLKLIYNIGHVLRVNSHCFGRCYVKNLILGFDVTYSRIPKLKTTFPSEVLVASDKTSYTSELDVWQCFSWTGFFVLF